MEPLAGYRALDFGWVITGPMVGAILADLGAEVIKVESRKRLDANRRMSWPAIDGQPVAGTRGPDPKYAPEMAPLFHQLNRNKLSIGVDLTHPQGAGLVKELVKKSNVVIENFAPGFLARVGLDYASLRPLKPDLVMVSLSGAGQYGPLASLRAYATTLTSLGGLESAVGYPGEPVLGGLQSGLSDPSAGTHAALVTLAALYHREQTGQGQYIDLSQMEVVASMLGEPIMDYQMNGRVARPHGNQHLTMAPHGNYPCKGQDQWVSIAVKTEEEWQSLCQAMGYPPWTKEERFADQYRRLKNREALDAFIAQWTARHEPYEATRLLQEAGVAAAPVLSMEQQHADPHFQARGLRVGTHHPLFGPENLYALPWKLSETPGGGHRMQPAPLLGQHNEYVFGEILGLSREQIAALVAEGVLEEAVA